MEPGLQKTAGRAAVTPRPAAAVPVTAPAPARVQLQSALRVSSPRDPAEREAEATAQRIMRVADPSPAGETAHRAPAGTIPRRAEPPSLARFADAVHLMRIHGAAPLIARKGEGEAAVAPGVAADIANAKPAGALLPAGVRRFMEPRFRADLGKVRVHTGDRAARLNQQLGAHAFTHGQHIFFGKGKFRPEAREGKELIAHELTHTIQQGAVVQRSADVTVSERSGGGEVQRLGISDVLDKFADWANAIPFYRMFTIVLGVNPINMSAVDRSAANIFRAVVEFMPGGNFISKALDAHGVFERAGAYVEGQLRSLGLSGASIKKALMDFLRSLGISDLFSPGSVWDRAKRLFSDPIDRIISFVKGLASAVIKLIKDAILRPLAALASKTAGWDLLCAVLGKNPITGDVVPRTAETLIGGFMKLIGQEEIWANIKKANAIARCYAWFQSALAGLLGFVREVPGLFLAALKALEIADIILLPLAFVKVGKVFGGFLVRFTSWAGDTIWNLLEIIFAVVAPAVMPYVKKAAAAFKTILKNPVGFVGNLTKAGKLGLSQFVRNFLKHLKKSLIGWLTGSLSGAAVYIPKALSLPEFGKFVLSVLGITWPKIRAKIVKALGPKGETIMKVLETGFDIVVALVKGGPAAAWELIKEKLTGLKDMVLSSITSFVLEKVVTAAITKLLSMLSPVGAFIQAIIGIYNTVMFFVERLKQIAAVAAAFIDSISAIANGVIAAAANRVEQTMGGLLTLVISFLARIAGLGKVTDKVVALVQKLQAKVDAGIDFAVGWVVGKAKAILVKLLAKRGEGPVKKPGGVVEGTPAERLKKGLATVGAKIDEMAPRGLKLRALDPVVADVRARFGFRVLEVRSTGGELVVHGEINPSDDERKKLKKMSQAASHPNAALVSDPETLFPHAVAVELDKAQAAMNSFYKSESKYGDASSAFMVLVEQIKGGVGNDPAAVFERTEKVRKQIGVTVDVNGREIPIYEKDDKGKPVYEKDDKGKPKEVKVPVLHFTKVEEGIVALEALIGPESTLVTKINAVPAPLKKYLTQATDAITRIRAEIDKMKEALEWAKSYRAGQNPRPPKWGNPFK